MKVLVTGANGFIGRHVLRCLERHYLEAVVLGRVRPSVVALESFIEADRPPPLHDTGKARLGSSPVRASRPFPAPSARARGNSCYMQAPASAPRGASAKEPRP